MKTLLLVLQLGPALIELISAVEKFFPESGKGKEKLELLKSILTTAYSEITELMPIIEKVVELVVDFANKIGAFKTSK